MHVAQAKRIQISTGFRLLGQLLEVIVKIKPMLRIDLQCLPKKLFAACKGIFSQYARAMIRIISRPTALIAHKLGILTIGACAVTIVSNVVLKIISKCLVTNRVCLTRSRRLGMTSDKDQSQN